MTRKSTSLLARVKDQVSVRRAPALNWFARLTPSQQEEFLAIRRAWKAGEITSSAVRLAQDIIDQANAMGIKTCGPAGMRSWLAKN